MTLSANLASRTTNRHDSAELARYLSFNLGAESFALPLLSVREVIAVPAFTPLPHAPSYFLGMINLRGKIISCIDLKAKLGIPSSDAIEPALIICEIGSAQVGVKVDCVSAVLSPKTDEISAKPVVESSVDASFIESVYRTEKNLVLFLNLGKALNASEWAIIEAPAGHSAA